MSPPCWPTPPSPGKSALPLACFPLRQSLFSRLFRNARASSPQHPGNKGNCPANPRGPMRLRSGTKRLPSRAGASQTRDRCGAQKVWGRVKMRLIGAPPPRPESTKPPPRSQAGAWERTWAPGSCLAKVRLPRGLPGFGQSRSFVIKKVAKRELGNRCNRPLAWQSRLKPGKVKQAG